MAFVPKKPAPAQQQRAQIPSPPPRRRIVAKPLDSAGRDPAAASQHSAAPSSAAERKAPRKRGHAQKDERGKYMPTGDYPEGFCRAPLKNRFDGSKPGPGRPKGVRSQASVEREELLKKRSVTLNGVRTMSSQRELATKLYFKQALEGGKGKELLAIMEMGRRHFPEVRTDDEAGQLFGAPGLDEAILGQFLAGMQLGEPADGAINPLADAAFAPSGELQADAEWSEGDWNEPGYDEPDPALTGSDADEEDGDDA